MKYSAISDECEQRTVVANHNAYSYIGQLYDIRFVTVHGLDPEGEPSAADIAEVLEQIEEDGLTVLFVEEYTNPDAVAGIVEQTKSGTMPDGISIQTLYTMEMPPMDSEDNYLSLMEKNLDKLKGRNGLLNKFNFVTLRRLDCGYCRLHSYLICGNCIFLSDFQNDA